MVDTLDLVLGILTIVVVAVMVFTAFSLIELMKGTKVDHD